MTGLTAPGRCRKKAITILKASFHDEEGRFRSRPLAAWSPASRWTYTSAEIAMGATSWRQLDRQFTIEGGWVFGLGDLFQKFGEVATAKELHDLWMTCRIYAK